MAAMNKTVELYRSKPEFGDEKTIAKAEREHREMTKELEKLAVRPGGLDVFFYIYHPKLRVMLYLLLVSHSLMAPLH
jgi:hypothetical protein